MVMAMTGVLVLVESCCPLKAYPSMAELSCGGTSKGETTSHASTRPKASNNGSSSCSSMGVTSLDKKTRTSSADRAWGS